MLGLAPHVRVINLARNARFTSKGIATLAAALVNNPAVAPRLREINLQHVHISGEASTALTALARARDVLIRV